MSYPTPGTRKAKGGASGADDGPQLQSWLNDIAGKSGTLDRWYLTSQTLRPHPETTIYGVGAEICGIAAHPALTADKMLIHSAASGLRLFDLGLRGTPALREAHGSTMLRVEGDDVLLHGCGLSWWRTLMMPVATNRLKITDCDFGHWADSITLPERASAEGKAIIAVNAALPVGKRKQEHELALRGHCVDDGGYALLGGNGSWPNDNVDVVGCTFHDGNWTAIECLQPLGIKWRIIGNTISRVHEAGIYCGASAVIERNTILDVRRRDCSAHCIEGGGLGTQITRNTFGRPDAAFMFLANPVGMYVGHNTMFDPMEEAAADSDPTPWSAGIFVRNLPAPPEHLANGLVVEQNDMWNSTGKATHCVSFFDFGGGPFRNVTCGLNRMAGKWKGKPLRIDPAAIGEGFHVIDH